MDAIIAERLTASPRIYDIYAFCGLGIMSEFFPHGDMEKVAVPEEDAVPEKPYDPKNNLTPMEKLEVAKQMAEAMADLHGYNGGVMVHQDIQLSQFLWTADKSRIKLNDFNRAEFMLWDESIQEYCTYSEGRGMGSVSFFSNLNDTLRRRMSIDLVHFAFFTKSGDLLKNIMTFH